MHRHTSAPLLLLTLMSAAAGAMAATPPMRRYTTADGLPTDTVTALHFDSRGFLWVGTDDGLARFDGERFTVFDDRSGLPRGTINAFLEDTRGSLYVATGQGVARLRDGADLVDRFEAIPVPAAEAAAAHGLAHAPDGSIVSATNQGLFRLSADASPPRWEPVPLGLPPHPDGLGCTFIRADRRGDLWSLCGSHLVRLDRDGRVDSWDLAQRLATPLGGMWLTDIEEDRRGRMWVSGSGFLWRLVDNHVPGLDPVARDYSDCPGGNLRIFSLLRRRDGAVWAATANGPAEIREDVADDGCPVQFMHEGTEASFRLAVALAEDEAGNLWASESSHGLVRIAAQGFAFFGHEDGIPYLDVGEIAEGPDGEVVALVGSSLFELQGKKFRQLDAKLPAGFNVGWGSRQRMLFDREGGLWLATRQGMLRWFGPDGLHRVERQPPDRVYSLPGGLARRAVMRMFEDSRGDLWIAPEEGAGLQLCRWSRGDDSIDCFGEEEGVPPVRVRSMVQDTAGQIWVAFREGTLLRRRGDRFERMNGRPGFTPSEINAILADGSGRIWVAAPREGLYRVDGAAEENPRFTLHAREAGLSSLDLRCLVEDEGGRIYIGTGRGIDRFDPAGGPVRHYTALEGLLDTSLLTAMRARNGTLWFGTADGIASLDPRPDPTPLPPRVYLMGLRIAGETRAVSARGAARLGDLSLGPNENNVEIEYTGIGQGPGEPLAFQTRLEGAEAGWSEPKAERSISYARLAPGSYTFSVRAVDGGGVTSASAASLTFHVAAPFWRQWWFVTLVAMGIAAVAAAFHRQRAARLVELERVRMRIATDLHDEVGAGLSEIALMGEVWARHEETGDGVPGRIASTSRRLVDSMSDIVWAINPEKDRVFSLSQRMRRYATTVLRSAGVALSFQSIDEPQDRALDGDARRELLLAFQEIVTNAIKHARCSRLDVRLEVRGSDLVVEVEDDGRGFDPAEPSEGTGRASLSRRAERLGGACRIRSRPGAGTRVTLQVPLQRRRRETVSAPP